MKRVQWCVVNVEFLPNSTANPYIYIPSYGTHIGTHVYTQTVTHTLFHCSKKKNKKLNETKQNETHRPETQLIYAEHTEETEWEEKKILNKQSLEYI